MRVKGRIVAIAWILSTTLLLSSCQSIFQIFKELNPDEQLDSSSTRVSSGHDAETEDSGVLINPSIEEEPETLSTRPRNFSVEDASRRQEESPEGLKPLRTVEIAHLAQPTVVAINTQGLRETYYGMMPSEGAGSGVIISEDGYIVTNYHVIDSADTIEVVLATGNSYKAELIGSNPINDLAVVKINADKILPHAIVGNSDDLMVGELAVAVGNPLGDFQGTVTSGIISSLGRTLILEQGNELIELRNLIQTDAAINAGNSGGGLFNSYGELIGINVAKASAGSRIGPTIEGLGFAIPMNTASPIINALVNEGYVSGMPVLQIMGSDISRRMAASYEGSLVEGVWVKEVAPGSAVDRAGLRAEDIIVAFEGVEITSIAQLNLIKNRYRAGDEVEITYYRDGETATIKFILDEYQESAQ